MFGRWRAVKNIHPPLPMSPQESQRLLALINTSFKQQLDRHHPNTVADHTSDHLFSILSNPLFEAKPTDIRVSSSTRHGKGGTRLGIEQILGKRPVDIFKEHIVAGTATLQSAILCLRAEYKNCCRISSTAVQGEALRTSRMGSIIIQWLWSSGADECAAVLENPDFVKFIVPFLVAEKRHDRVWAWLDHLCWDWARISLSQAALRHRVYRMLLFKLVQSERYVGEGLDAAIALFIRSANKCEWKNWTETHELAAWYLTRELKEIPRATAIQDGTIESFMKASGTLSKPKTILSGCHWLYLAKIPDPDVALGYFKTVSNYGLRSKRRRDTVLIGLKTIEVLLESGRQAEASWLTDHVLKNFSCEVGSLATSDQKSKSQDLEESEERSLRSLDALAIQ
ncbi:hypothetical protein N7G274_001813 [Stereocaulon virgatum]|uniref:Uncharacterized protein n=1 Tax=Stereocaulon virgatum TaxID=373712 RepID=A0ABR4ANJ1_9LECA